MPGKYPVAVALIFCLAALVGQPLDSVVHAGWSEAKTAYENGDFAKAFNEFKALAEQNNADAQRDLGAMYCDGKGVAQDYGEAVKWFAKPLTRELPGRNTIWESCTWTA